MIKLILALILVLSSSTATVDSLADSFSQGRVQFSLLAGNGSAFDQQYFVLGVGITNYLLDGLGAGIDIEKWSGSDPGIIKYSPFIQYVFKPLRDTRPYIGGFYRLTDVDTLPDVTSVGARAGVYFSSFRNTYVSAGIVYESYLDCRETIYSRCNETYPDLSFTVGF